MVAAILGMLARHWRWVLIAALVGGLAVQGRMIGGLRADIEAHKVARQAAAGALRTAAAEIRARNALLIANGAREADDATDAARFWKGQCKGAFDAGYASRRCDGGPAADPGGLRGDLRSLWSAYAFTGAAPGVPGEPGG